MQSLRESVPDSSSDSLSFHEDFLRTEEIRDTLHKTEMPNLKQRGGSCSSDSQVTEKHHPSLASQDDELVDVYLDRNEVNLPTPQ